MFKQYVDPNSYKKVKKEAKKIGFSSSSVTPVDLEYGYVPTRVSQSAKGGSSNMRKAAAMNRKRFGYDEED